MDLREKIKNLPLGSGVYLMRDAQGRVIYVGKAVSLRKRVQSYFRAAAQSPKTGALVPRIKDIDFLETQSEAEALILEASLIKQYQPKFNVDLKDDKTYPYIEVTGDEFPGIFLLRPRTFSKQSKYYGPYVNAKLIREALTIIRKIFPFRTCSPLARKACLDYHIGLCPGPCAGKISAREYSKIIRNVRLILEGKKDELFAALNREMERHVRQKAFEEAAKVRDQIRALGALYSGTGDVNYFKGLEQLQRALRLPKRPDRIEAFDISNIMGNQSVGSMVSFLNGNPDKSQYRRFRIKEVAGIDDVQMMAEVVRRRYRRLKNEGRMFPDLILVDGGKGQLSAACAELEKVGAEIPVISLAKRAEEIFLPGRRQPVVLAGNSLGLQLLQRIRDEAHRFAISYHKYLRAKSTYL